jgi:hypothetical protein
MQVLYTKVDNPWLLERVRRAWGPCAHFIVGGELALEHDEDIVYQRRLAIWFRHTDDFYCIPYESDTCENMFEEYKAECVARYCDKAVTSIILRGDLAVRESTKAVMANLSHLNQTYGYGFVRERYYH